MKSLKKVFVSIFFAVLILSACNSSQLSFSKIENVSQKFEEHIDPDLNLQLMMIQKVLILFFIQREI